MRPTWTEAGKPRRDPGLARPKPRLRRGNRDGAIFSTSIETALRPPGAAVFLPQDDGSRSFRSRSWSARAAVHYRAVLSRGREIVESIDPQDFHTGFARLGERGPDDRFVDSASWRSSWMPVMPFCVPAILKSMFAVVVLVADDISEQHPLIAFLDQTSRDAGTDW